MGELKGFLYICDSTLLSDVSMWVMNEYGTGESWTKIYNIDTSFNPSESCVQRSYDLSWPIKHFEEGAAILLYHSSNCFIYYEPEKYGFKVFRIHGYRSDFLEVNLMVDSPLQVIVIDFNHKTSIQRDFCKFPMLPLIF